MLKKLVIKNVALISNAEIPFIEGLNVLSGETGAGKSVIIESLNFVLGAKADKNLIKSGETECLVKAEFSVENNGEISDIFNELDIDYDGDIIISRKFNVDGKSSIKINGENVTSGMLKKLTSKLVDVHGQSEHFYLLKNQNQLDLIDKFGGEEIFEVKQKLNIIYKEYKDILQKIDNLGGDEAHRLIRLDVLNYQINEIESCDISENEETELLEIKEKLKHQEKIVNALLTAKSCISDEGGVSDVLSNAIRSLSNITDLGKEYLELYERISNLFSELDDVSDTANGLLDEFDYSSYNADEIEDRLSVIKSLKKKYGNDYKEIIDFLNSAKEERANLENFNELAGQLTVDKLNAEKELYKTYQELSDLRRKSADIFTRNVLKEVRELGMSKAEFEVGFSNFPDFESCRFNSSNGTDEVEFLFSANLGQPLKPLSAIISGGEISRFMLSIKAQTAKYGNVSTFIFDEIDAGISGLVAKIVAQKFAKISKDVQIIAISHLPQISAMADNNLLIIKSEKETHTETIVKTLSASDKIEELTRLVGGNIESESAKIHAKELIDAADKFKQTL